MSATVGRTVLLVLDGVGVGEREADDGSPGREQAGREEHHVDVVDRWYLEGDGLQGARAVQQRAHVERGADDLEAGLSGQSCLSDGRGAQVVCDDACGHGAGARSYDGIRHRTPPC